MKRSMLAALAAVAARLSIANAQEEKGAAPGSGAPGHLPLKGGLTDLGRRVLGVHESIPVKPGPLTLLYPEWLPGNHAPRGPIDGLAGLLINANGRRLVWTRDPLKVYAFHRQAAAG